MAEKGKFKYNLWEHLLILLKNFLKKKAIKMVLSKLLMLPALAGPIGWVVAYLIDIGFDKVIVPLVELGVRKGKLIYEIHEGTVNLKHAKKAISDNDRDAYSSSMSDL